MNLSGHERLLYINYSKQINKLYKKYCFKNIIINPYKLKDLLGETIDDIVWQYMDEEENIVRECIIKKVDKNKKGVVHIIDMIDNEKFWEIMSDELDKTSQEDWEQFVKEHDMGERKMKQYYSTENFNVDNYGDEYLSIAVTLNKCAVNNIVAIFDKYSLSFDCIEHIVFDCNAQEQLTLYVSYEKKNKKHNKIVKINIEDFSVLENEWIDFVAEMFYMTFISKEEN